MSRTTVYYYYVYYYDLQSTIQVEKKKFVPSDIVIMRVLLTPFGMAPYYVKKHVTRRKVANIKHELFVDHGVSNIEDDDTSVRNVGDDDIDGFVVGYYWEGAVRVKC